MFFLSFGDQAVRVCGKGMEKEGRIKMFLFYYFFVSFHHRLSGFLTPITTPIVVTGSQQFTSLFLAPLLQQLLLLLQRFVLSLSRFNHRTPHVPPFYTHEPFSFISHSLVSPPHTNTVHHTPSCHSTRDEHFGDLLTLRARK